MDAEHCLASIEVALADGDATLAMDFGGAREVTQVRLWRGQVLVDWEPDNEVGDCLLRPAQLRRLIALDARVGASNHDVLELHAPGRVVAGLSARHADLVKRLGGARRVAMTLHLRFDGQTYLGGDETYTLIERGRQISLMRLDAEVRVRTPRAASPRMSPLTT